MRIVIDTNVVMDILLKRMPFFHDSYAALVQVIERGGVCVLSASAATDVFYLLRQALKDATKARAYLEAM